MIVLARSAWLIFRSIAPCMTRTACTTTMATGYIVCRSTCTLCACRHMHVIWSAHLRLFFNWLGFSPKFIVLKLSMLMLDHLWCSRVNIFIIYNKYIFQSIPSQGRTWPCIDCRMFLSLFFFLYECMYLLMAGLSNGGICMLQWQAFELQINVVEKLGD